MKFANAFYAAFRACFAGVTCWPTGIGSAPVSVTSAVLDRMPVILDPDAYDVWLDPGMQNVIAASDLLKPCDARLMRCYPVSTRINSGVKDDAACSAAVEVAEVQDRLFS